MQYGSEGQADYFAGTLLKSSRQFSPAQMQKLIDWVTPSVGDHTHAPGKTRAELMRAGIPRKVSEFSSRSYEGWKYDLISENQLHKNASLYQQSKCYDAPIWTDG